MARRRSSARRSAPPVPPYGDYAGFGKRFGAFLVDTALVTVAISLPISLSGVFLEKTIPTAGAALQFYLTLISFGVPQTLLTWPYFAVLESSPWQATVGKRIMNLKVTTLNGKRPSFKQTSIRFFASWLSSLMYLGYLMMFIHPRRQTLHDILAETLVLDPAAVNRRNRQAYMFEQPDDQPAGRSAPKNVYRPSDGPLAPAATQQTAQQPKAKLDINQAGEQELSPLPGIGPILAKKAVQYRSRYGAFQSLDVFFNVLNIRPHMRNRLEELLVCGDSIGLSARTPAEESQSRPGFETKRVPLDTTASAGSTAEIEAAGPEHRPELLDVNRLAKEELLDLPGLQTDMVYRLLHERRKRNGFDTIEEVWQVLQLPPEQQAKLAGLLTVKPYQPSKRRVVDW